MTELQKHTVLELRQQGLKYREIAEHLGVTEAAIKMFLSRSQRARRCCENCGRLLPKNARKTQRFCSGACRHKWWNRNLDKLKNSNRTGHTCRICGKRFLSYKNAKYCSRTCYYKSRRKKHVNPRTPGNFGPAVFDSCIPNISNFRCNVFRHKARPPV